MTEITKEQLIYVANELNDLLYEPPAIPVAGTKDKILKKMLELTESFGILERGDKLTDECVDILNLLGYNSILHEIGYPVEPPGNDSDPEPEENDPEPEENDPEPEETVPEQEEDEPPPEEVPEEVPVPEKVEDELEDVSLADMNVSELVNVLKKSGVVPTRRSKSTFARGQSPYSLAITMCCKYPNMSSKDLVKNFVKETGFEGEMGSHERRSIQTAWSLVRKVLTQLEEFGHLPSADPVKKPITRKTTKK